MRDLDYSDVIADAMRCHDEAHTVHHEGCSVCGPLGPNEKWLADLLDSEPPVVTQIVGIVPDGCLVKVHHDGHPYDGESVFVVRKNGSVGGIGGGGAVWVRSWPHGELIISRYTRVVLLEEAS